MFATLLFSLPEAVALTLLAALPSFFNPATERIFEEEKALLLRTLALIALPAAIVARDRRLQRHPVVLAFLGLTLMLLVATIAGVDPRTAMLGAYLKRHGLVTWIALAVVFAALCGSATSEEGRNRLLNAAVIGSLWPSVYALLQRAGADPIQWTGPAAIRSLSSFGSPNYLGGYLVMIVPLTLLRLRSTRWVWAVVALQLAALAATASRGSIVALVAGTLTGGLLFLWRRPGGRRRAALSAAIVVAAALTLAAVPALRPAPLARVFDASSGSGRVRILIWKGVIDLMGQSRARLWIGYGPESLNAIFPPVYPAELGIVEGTDAMPDRAHNESLDLLVSAGVPGLILELMFFGAVLVSAARVPNALTAAFLLAAATGHVVEVQLGIATVVSRLMFLAVAALTMGNGEGAAQASASAVPRAEARRGRRASQAGRPASPGWRVTRHLWIAAGVGAISPWVGALVTPQSPVTGTERELVAYLDRISMVTPWSFGLVAVAAILLAWAISGSARQSRGWALGWATLAAAAAAWPLAITPSRADVFSKSATQFEAGQQWTEAAAAYQEAARLQPREAYFLAGLGRARLQDAVRRGPVAGAAGLRGSREAFERALALRPSDPDNARHLGSLARVEAAFREQGRDGPLAEADRLYAEATRRAPGLTPLWIDWGWVDADRRRWSEALDKVNHALTLNPTRASAFELRDYIRAAGVAAPAR